VNAERSQVAPGFLTFDRLPRAKNSPGYRGLPPPADPPDEPREEPPEELGDGPREVVFVVLLLLLLPLPFQVVPEVALLELLPLLRAGAGAMGTRGTARATA
jgi:hypothetical protein